MPTPSPDRMGYAKERTPNGWTLQTLHDHFLELLRASKALEDERFRTQDVARETETAAIRQRFADFDKAINAALAAAEKAVNAALVAQNTAVSKAEEASNKRFDGVNEFRAALTDQSNTMLPRTEADQRFKGMEERLARQERISSERAGSQAQGESSKNMNMWMIGLTVTVVLAVAAIVADIIIRH